MKTKEQLKVIAIRQRKQRRSIPIEDRTPEALKALREKPLDCATFVKGLSALIVGIKSPELFREHVAWDTREDRCNEVLECLLTYVLQPVDNQISYEFMSGEGSQIVAEVVEMVMPSMKGERTKPKSNADAAVRTAAKKLGI